MINEDSLTEWRNKEEYGRDEREDEGKIAKVFCFSFRLMMRNKVFSFSLKRNIPFHLSDRLHGQRSKVVNFFFNIVASFIKLIQHSKSGTVIKFFIPLCFVDLTIRFIVQKLSRTIWPFSHHQRNTFPLVLAHNCFKWLTSQKKSAFESFIFMVSTNYIPHSK